MRKILFRGKRVDNGKWVYGYYWHVEEHYDSSIKAAKIHFIKSIKNGIDYRIDENTLGQYIGLKDKKGKEIFEGDIVLEYDFWDKPTEYVHKVEWDDESCGFEPLSDSKNNCGHCGGGLNPNDCKIVGNIYDNPEMIAKKNAR